MGISFETALDIGYRIVELIDEEPEIEQLMSNKEYIGFWVKKLALARRADCIELAGLICDAHKLSELRKGLADGEVLKKWEADVESERKVIEAIEKTRTTNKGSRVDGANSHWSILEQAANEMFGLVGVKIVRQMSVQIGDCGQREAVIAVGKKFGAKSAEYINLVNEIEKERILK